MRGLIDSIRAVFRSLSTRLLLLTLLWVSFVTGSIGYSILLNWQIESTVLTMESLSELRYHAYRSGIYAQSKDYAASEREIVAFRETMDAIRSQDRFDRWTPGHSIIPVRLARLDRQWTVLIEPQLLNREPPRGFGARLYQVNTYVEQISLFVDRLEDIRNEYMHWLSVLQWLIIIMGFASLFVIMHCLAVWVLQPLQRLGRGIALLSNGHLTHRVRIEGGEELRFIGAGFNHMAERLEDLFSDLEKKVADKTEALEVQKQKLRHLLELTSYLATQRGIDETLEGFTERLTRTIHSDAMVVLMPVANSTDLRVAWRLGIPDDIARRFGSVLTSSALVSQAMSRRSIMRVGLRFNTYEQHIARLYEAGYQTAYIVPVTAGTSVNGAFILLFKEAITLSWIQCQELEGVSTHWSVLIENANATERDRMYAIMQERNLMARGLHDSIAQGLSYLNLQVQFLQSALEKNDVRARDEAVEAIRVGLKESYDDVRELLLNFRDRVHKEGLEESLRKVLTRFEAQSGVQTTLKMVGSGPRLTDRQRVQAVFIVQEALSNVRKHAKAQHVQVTVCNRRDFTVTIEDDGVGLDAELMEQRKGQHVGLSIMSERAQRMNATVEVRRVSDRGGTRVTLHLKSQDRETHVS